MDVLGSTFGCPVNGILLSSSAKMRAGSSKNNLLGRCWRDRGVVQDAGSVTREARSTVLILHVFHFDPHKIFAPIDMLVL